MSALTVVQTVCLELVLNVPNSVVSSSDPQIKQILSLANRTGKDLADRYTWQALTKQASFTTVAQQSQGNIETIAPGYSKIINETMWDRSLQQPVFGPDTPAGWAASLSGGFSGGRTQYRIMGNELHVIPAPPDGSTWAFEYKTKHWVSDEGQSTTRAAYAADGDYALLDEDLIILGTLWRWNQRKGFTYGEDFAEYERRVANAMAADGTKPVLNTSGRDRSSAVAPEGSWSL